MGAGGTDTSVYKFKDTSKASLNLLSSCFGFSVAEIAGMYHYLEPHFTYFPFINTVIEYIETLSKWLTCENWQGWSGCFMHPSCWCIAPTFYFLHKLRQAICTLLSLPSIDQSLACK